MKELFKPRTIIAFAFYGTYLCLIIKGCDVPKTLEAVITTLFGFYFGQKIKGTKQ